MKLLCISAGAFWGVTALTITPSEVNLIFVGLGTFLTALALVIPVLVSAFRSIRAAMVQNAAETNAKIDEVKAEAKVISGHVNSAATASAVKADALQEQIARLTQQLAESKQIAVDLAKSTAAAAIAVAAAPGTTATANGDAATKSLHAIDGSTAQIQKNTAKTEAIVADTNAIAHELKGNQ